MGASGYKDSLFFNLSAEEKESLSCSICFNILRDPYQCRNGHHFCYCCITTWTQTGLGHLNACPSCRAEGGYKDNRDLKEKIDGKIVKCEWKRCFWTGKVKELETHQHLVYVERSKNGRSSSLETGRPVKSEKSKRQERQMLDRNRAMSERIQSIHTDRNDTLNKQWTEYEWRKINNEERFRSRQRRKEADILSEDSRLMQRLKNIDSRKQREVEENQRRIHNYQMKKTKHRETFLRRFHRQENEVRYEDELMWERIDRQTQRRRAEQHKALQRRKEMEIFVKERTEAFLRKLDRDNKEWKHQILDLLHRIQRKHPTEYAAPIMRKTDEKQEQRPATYHLISKT